MGGGAGFGVGAGLEQELGRVGTGQEQGRSKIRIPVGAVVRAGVVLKKR